MVALEDTLGLWRDRYQLILWISHCSPSSLPFAGCLLCCCHYRPGVDFKLHNIKVGDKTVRLHVWDTAGQERYRSISSSYYRNSDGIILVFDMTSSESLIQMERWVEHLEEQLSPRTKVFIVGNKMDEVSYTSVGRIREFARSKGCGYKEVSAKTGDQVQELFFEVAQSIKEYYDQNGLKSTVYGAGMRLGPGGSRAGAGANGAAGAANGTQANGKDKAVDDGGCCS